MGVGHGTSCNSVNLSKHFHDTDVPRIPAMISRFERTSPDLALSSSGGDEEDNRLRKPEAEAEQFEPAGSKS